MASDTGLGALGAEDLVRIIGRVPRSTINKLILNSLL